MLNWGDVHNYGSSEVAGAAAWVSVRGKHLFVVRVERAAWRVSKVLNSMAPGETVASGTCSSLDDGKEKAEAATEELLLEALHKMERSPMRLVAWCAILLRDELVLRGESELIGALGQGDIRPTFLNAVVGMVSLDVTADHLDGDSHETLRARIGIGRLAIAADEVINTYRVVGQIASLEIEARGGDEVKWRRDQIIDIEATEAGEDAGGKDSAS